MAALEPAGYTISYGWIYSEYQRPTDLQTYKLPEYKDKNKKCRKTQHTHKVPTLNLNIEQGNGLIRDDEDSNTDSIDSIDPTATIKYKVKVNLSLCLTKNQAMNMYWGSGGIGPRIRLRH
jgi:hypothetical protein